MIKTEYLIINGDSSNEQKQLTLIEDCDNIKKMTIQNCGHNVGKILKDRDLLKPILKEFFKIYD